MTERIFNELWDFTLAFTPTSPAPVLQIAEAYCEKTRQKHLIEDKGIARDMFWCINAALAEKGDLV